MAHQASAGHKVVAMPPADSPFANRGRMDEPTESSAALPYYRRLRSRSAGRAPASRSRDIVQDVYDRMGVNYIRGRPSINNLLEDNKALGYREPEPAEDGRGRSTTRHSDMGIRPNLAVGARQRSRSRGRTRQWPPASVVSSEKPATPEKPVDSNNWFSPTPNGGSKTERKSMPYNSSKSLLDTDETDGRDEESRHDAPDDERDGLSVVSGKSFRSVKSSKSVKDRISAYGVSIRKSTGSSSVVGRHSYGGSFKNKVINAQKKNNSADKEGSVVSFPQGFKVAKDLNAETSSRMDQASYVSGARNRFSSQTSVSQRSAKSGVADAFLSALGKSNGSVVGNVPVVEVPKDGFNQNIDLLSIAASSMSGEDFAPSSFAPSPRKKTGPLFRTGGNQGVDKAVEDHIQSQMSIVSNKFEAEVRRLENRIDQECKARIENLEKKNEELVDLLARRGIKEGSKFF